MLLTGSCSSTSQKYSLFVANNISLSRLPRLELGKPNNKSTKLAHNNGSKKSSCFSIELCILGIKYVRQQKFVLLSKFFYLVCQVRKHFKLPVQTLKFTLLKNAFTCVRPHCMHLQEAMIHVKSNRKRH